MISFAKTIFQEIFWTGKAKTTIKIEFRSGSDNSNEIYWWADVERATFESHNISNPL